MKNIRINTKFLVEGKTERALLKALQSKIKVSDNSFPKIVSGKTNIFNLWTTNAAGLKTLINKNELIVAIFDTDTINSTNLNRFISNIVLLSKHCREIILVQQNLNLEDELVNATCLLNLKELYGLFNSNKTNFKNDFLKEKNLVRKLCSKNFEVSLLWNSKKIFSNQLKTVKGINKVNLGKSKIVL